MVKRDDFITESEPGIGLFVREIQGTASVGVAPIVLVHGARVPGLASFDLLLEDSPQTRHTAGSAPFAVRGGLSPPAPFHPTRRRLFAYAVLAGLVAAIALPASVPAYTALSGGCTTSWAAPVSGSWFEPANWTTTAVPTSADDVCISEAGAYTVSVDGNGAAARSLAIGGSASTPTLSLVGGSLTDSALTVAETIDVGSGATVELTSTGAPAAAALTAGGVSNGGTIGVRLGSGGDRRLTANLTNSGTVTIDATLTFDGPSATWLNAGATTIGDGIALSLPGGQTFTNAGGGSLSEVGSGQLQLTGSTLNFGTGSFSGDTPILLTDSNLNLANGTAANFLWHGTTGQLSGNLTAGQKLSAVALCSEDAQVNATSSFSNAGTIELSASGCDGPGASLAYAPHTLTNTGTIAVSAGTGGSRSITGNLTNMGPVTVERSLTFDGSSATWTNQGPLTIADGTTVLLPSGQTFTNTTSGSIATGNSGQLQLIASTFNHGAGTISWNHPPIGSYPSPHPVLLDGSNLNVTSTNTVSFLWHGSGELTGGLPGTAEEITVEGTCAGPAQLNAGSSFTNNGSLELAAAGCASDATINLPPGATLTNTNLLQGLNGSLGGARVLNGNLAQRKNFGLDHNVNMQVNGNYLQTTNTLTRFLVFGDSDFARLTVSGSATLNGKLDLLSLAGYKPGVGAELPIITAASRIGTFSKITHTAFGSRYLAPVYSATGLTMVGGQGFVSVAPTTGPPGTSVTVTGTGWPASDSIKLAFKDHAGVKTALGSATTDSSGAFSTTVAIPAGAAAGKGTFSGRSTLTGALASKTFTVS